MKINKSLLALAAASGMALTMFTLQAQDDEPPEQVCLSPASVWVMAAIWVGLRVPMRTVSSWLPMRGLGIAAGNLSEHSGP